MVTDDAARALIRAARGADAARIGEIARAAYGKYVPRIDRAPAPMLADFAAEIAAARVVVIEAEDTIVGYPLGRKRTVFYRQHRGRSGLAEPRLRTAVDGPTVNARRGPTRSTPSGSTLMRG